MIFSFSFPFNFKFCCWANICLLHIISVSADKTRRGLTGKALAGKSAGGLPYGYRVTRTGEREIDPAQAAVVRRIFADYIAGQSARQIAHALNREGIPSGRGKSWAVSAIQPDHKRGIGILANPIYKGLQIWNRSTWVKNPETRLRVRRDNPESEWITSEHPELAIVTPEIWAAARAACQRRSVKSGLGKRPVNLLSGLLRCKECGGPIVVVDATYYGCATAKDRGVCGNTLKVNRKQAEAAMLAHVRELLLSDESMTAWLAAIAQQLRQQQGQSQEAKRRLQATLKERDNLLAALRAGIITSSTKAELERIEALCESLEQQANAPLRVMTDIRPRLQALADNLASVSSRHPKAREALRAAIGSAVLTNKNGVTGALVTPIQIMMVAGAGFEPATFGL